MKKFWKLGNIPGLYFYWPRLIPLSHKISITVNKPIKVEAGDIKFDSIEIKNQYTNYSGTPDVRAAIFLGKTVKNIEFNKVKINNSPKDGTKNKNSAGISVQTGNETSAGVSLKLIDSEIVTSEYALGYPIRSFSKVNVEMENTTLTGYCATYFKTGSSGSALSAKNCSFNAQNMHSGESSDFGVIVFEDSKNCSATLEDCSVNATTIAGQTSKSYLLVTQVVTGGNGVPTPQAGKIVVKGDKTKVKGNLVSQGSGEENVNSVSFEAGLYTNDPTSYVDSTKYDVVTLKEDDNGYSDGYRYKVVAKAGN